MGNTNPEQSHQQKRPAKRFVMELTDQNIILDYKNKVKVVVGDIFNFPSEYDGLHIWDANIILARYALLNKHLFKDKKVIELHSGTGIASIVVKKYSEALTVAATDSKPEIVENILTNCKKNSISSGMIIARIAWEEYANFKTKFDFVMGADLFTKTTSLDLLHKVICKLLPVGGRALFVLPARSLNIADSFVAQLDADEFVVTKTTLEDQIYLESPLLNKVLGSEQFPLIAEGCFHLYSFERIKQVIIDSAAQPNSQEKAPDQVINEGKRLEGAQQQDKQQNEMKDISSEQKQQNEPDIERPSSEIDAKIQKVESQSAQSEQKPEEEEQKSGIQEQRAGSEGLEKQVEKQSLVKVQQEQKAEETDKKQQENGIPPVQARIEIQEDEKEQNNVNSEIQVPQAPLPSKGEEEGHPELEEGQQGNKEAESNEPNKESL